MLLLLNGGANITCTNLYDGSQSNATRTHIQNHTSTVPVTILHLYDRTTILLILFSQNKSLATSTVNIRHTATEGCANVND